MSKTKINKILIPVDFSETSEIVMAEAIMLAKLLKAEVHLIHVIEFKGYYFAVIPETQTILPSYPELEKAVEKKMEELLEKIKNKFAISPEIFITSGNVDSEIINFSKEKKFDLIVMGTHGTSGFNELFLGSNAQRVVTLSDVPVLTMQSKLKHSGFKNILIPIDNSLHSREKVNMAMLIANVYGATLHIIGLPDSGDMEVLNKINIKIESVEKIIINDNLPHKTTIVHDKNLAEDALKYAEENNCDLIVINTGHESKLTGIFLGAFAQQIVNHSKIPVLSIKHAEGYLSIDTPGFGIG